MKDKFIKVPKGTCLKFFDKKIKIKEDLFLLKESPLEEIERTDSINRAKKIDKLILKEGDKLVS
jgi:hypothetical protein